jgi:tetratricopeptide (TPR) repeat protein
MRHNAWMNAAIHYQEGLKLSAKGRHAEAISRYEAALAADPADTRVLFALGNTARVLGLPKPAEEFYRRVLAAEPGRIEALVNLANLLRANGQFEAARALIEPALSRHSECAELWLTLGSIHRELGNSAEAKTHYGEALKFKPDYAAALGNLADLLADDGETDEALSLYDRALKREPDNAQARLNRAILHLGCGNLKDGWRDYAARLKLPGKAPKPDHNLPKWAGGALKRTRLLVTAEQGVGDELMFASMIGDLGQRVARENGSVILECEKRLVPLFARSFRDVTVKPSQMETKAGITTSHYGWLKAAGGANVTVEMGNLPRWLRGEISAFPNPHAYLIPDPQEVTNWKNIFGNAIGICWRSGKQGGGRALQYAPLEAWVEFIRNVPGNVVSVQYDANAEEIAALQTLSGREILVPQGIDQKQELDRACALLSALDCVVSAPTAVSWLAAGAGVPTYKILYDKSWTSFGADYEPFAPSCLCMMPERAGDWAEVFAKALAAIRQQHASA